MNKELYKIKDYIETNYQLNVEISPVFLHKYNLLIRQEKYDLEIAIEKPRQGHYLYGKNEYVLFIGYEANKKYRNELNYHGGGYSDGYNKKDYSNIDKFLNKWFSKKLEKQLTIFDYIKELGGKNGFMD